VELDQYLKERGALVNEALEKLLPSADRYPSRVHEAMRYSLFAGGKRLRPILVLAAFEAVGGVGNGALNTACAFECIHTYSLIHDDLPAMDDDDLRRGKPTSHKEFDEATAILAGDALLTIAFQMMAESSLKAVDKERLLRVVFEVAHAAGSLGMIGGQMADIEAEGTDVSLPELQQIHILKTGTLMLSAIRCGAILGGASEADFKALDSYGKSIGLAFQIADDILDVQGTTAELGKSAGADEKRGKATYPAHLGVEESKRRAAELVERAVSSLESFDERAEPLREIASYITERKG
jgi:geranylgeranyl diphosphate synthase type II